MKEFQDEDFVEVVLTASRALVAIAARSLAAVDAEVTLPQYRAVVFLCARGAVTMGELAQELDCSPSTATRLCDRLVAIQALGRSVRPENRREVVVEVTERGRELVQQVTDQRRREIARIVRTISGPERAAVVGALRTFSEAAGEAPDQAWSTGWDL